MPVVRYLVFGVEEKKKKGIDGCVDGWAEENLGGWKQLELERATTAGLAQLPAAASSRAVVVPKPGPGPIPEAILSRIPDPATDPQ